METITICKEEYNQLIRIKNALSACNEVGLLDLSTSNLIGVNSKTRQEARAALTAYAISEKAVNED